MIKRVAVCSLKEGTDPDDFWEYHKKVHAVDAMNVAGPRLKRYVINRVTKVIRGEPVFFDLIESWWETEEDMHQAWDVDSWEAEKADGQSVQDDFWSQTAGGFTAVVEEYVVKE